MKFKVILEQGQDGYIVVHCPSLKGCWSQGKTEEEAIRNIIEAIQLYLEPDEKELEGKDYYKVLEVAV